MKSFSDLGIQQSSRLIGEKIKINKVLNREIIIHKAKIEQSKYPKNKSGKCLYLQIELEEEKHVIFTGSDVLIETIQQVDEQDYPFTATIIKSGEYFQFT